MHIDHRASGTWHWELGQPHSRTARQAAAIVHTEHQLGDKHLLWTMLDPKTGATPVNKTHQAPFSGRFVAQPNPHPQGTIPRRREIHPSLPGISPGSSCLPHHAGSTLEEHRAVRECASKETAWMRVCQSLCLVY